MKLEEFELLGAELESAAEAGSRQQAAGSNVPIDKSMGLANLQVGSNDIPQGF